MRKRKYVSLANSYYKSSAIFLIFSLASSVLNYAYYPAVARFLSPEEFGSVQALIAILLQVGAFFAGLGLATIYLVNKLGNDKAKLAIETLQKLTTAFFLLATLLVLLFQAEVLKFLNIDGGLYMLILAVDLLSSIPFVIAFGYLQARKQFTAAGSLQLTVVSIKLASGVLLAWQYGAAGALAGIAVGQILGMFLFWSVGRFSNFKLWDYSALSSLSLPLRKELRLISPFAKPTIAIFTVNIVLIIYISFAVIAAKHYFPAELSGLFTGAVTLSSAIVFACLPLIGVLLPHLHAKKIALSGFGLLRTLALVTGISLASIIILSTFGNELLAIFGNEYRAMSEYLPGLAIIMSLVAILTLVIQVSSFYEPVKSAFIAIWGVAGLIVAVSMKHQTLSVLVSTMTLVFATILLIASVQIIWIYKYGNR